MRLTARQTLLLLAPLALLLGGWLVVPAAVGLAATLTTYSPLTTTVAFVGGSNYGGVIRDPQFGEAVRNVLLFTAVAVPLELGVGFVVAYLLRRPIWGRSWWRAVVLLPWLVSPIAVGVMWHYLLGGATGILNFALAWLGLPEAPSPIGDVRLALLVTIAIEVWRVGPFVAFLLLPGLLAVPRDRWELATLAGARWHERILRIAIPEIWPLLLTVGMLLTGLSLGAFDTILILTGGGPGTATLTPALYSYDRAFVTNDWPLGAASAWLIAAGVAAVGAVYIRLARRRA
ncbi:MAG TPA: sugar ABC transporter permease [Candidatus Dormibacteraeota bacterium]|nr:sugar ABC transporter permease [Candidatus Dormibacteraeota bacterium]